MEDQERSSLLFQPSQFRQDFDDLRIHALGHIASLLENEFSRPFSWNAMENMSAFVIISWP